MARMDTDLFAAFASKVVERLPRDMDSNVAQGLIDNPSSLGLILRGALIPPDKESAPTPVVTCPTITPYAYPTITPYAITVDYSLSFEEMVAAGKYDCKNDDITATHFPVPMKSSALAVGIELQLVHFNRVVDSPGKIIWELDRLGRRPAYIEELRAFGAKYPEEQRRFPIVELRSVWQDFCGVSLVARLWVSLKRSLDLALFEEKWLEYYRFAAVYK